LSRIESTGLPAGSIADDREDRRTLHPELRCVRGGWAKTLIGDGTEKEDGLAINGRPTTDLLSSRTRLRLRRGVRSWSRLPEGNRGTDRRIFGSVGTTRGGTRYRRGSGLLASGAGCDESSPQHADGSFRQGRTRLRETPNVGAYLIKAGHEQRHEGQAAREVLSAAQEERTSEGRTP
jgi:hypothetical protein